MIQIGKLIGDVVRNIYSNNKGRPVTLVEIIDAVQDQVPGCDIPRYVESMVDNGFLSREGDGYVPPIVVL